jgi:transposase-like protein
VPRSGGQRQFSEHAKRLIVEETDRPGTSVSAVARRYGIAVSVLFRWKHALKCAAEGKPVFMPERLDQTAAGPPAIDSPSSPSTPPAHH